MGIQFNVVSVVLLFGIVQGLSISAVLIFSKNEKRQGKYFLAAFLLALAYNSFGTFCWSSGLRLPWFISFDRTFPYTIMFTAGSSLYLYIKAISHPETVPVKVILRSYLPAFVDLALRMSLLAYAVAKDGDDVLGIERVYHPVALIALVFVFGFFLISAIRIATRSIALLPEDARANGEQIRAARWTKGFLVVVTIIAVCWAVTIFGTVLFGLRTLEYFEPVEVLLACFVYWIGLRSYHSANVIYVYEPYKPNAMGEKITTQQADAYAALLERKMTDDHLYLDADLSLDKLANVAGLNARIVSAVLNKRFNKGYNTFVNEYRVEAVKTRLMDAAYAHLTNFGIAQGCGFRSEATFHRVFKEIAGVSPSEFRNRAIGALSERSL